jgi:hypothetical protein
MTCHVSGGPVLAEECWLEALMPADGDFAGPGREPK